MFHARTGKALLLHIGQHFAQEVAVQLSAEERQNVLRRKVDRGVIQQPRVEFSQLRPAGEQDVRGEFRLCGHPGVRKPDPEIFQLALRQLDNIKPSQALFLDDYPANVEAAKSLGMETILVGEDPNKTVADIDACLLN